MPSVQRVVVAVGDEFCLFCSFVAWTEQMDSVFVCVCVCVWERYQLAAVACRNTAQTPERRGGRFRPCTLTLKSH